MAHKTSSKAGSPNRTSAKSLKKTTSRRAKATKAAASESTTVVAESEVPIDRRHADRRKETLDAETAKNGAPLERRKKVNRRRQIDPTTCERDYTDQEVEFMNALDDYKRKSGRMFPTCSEVLEVLRGLGYAKLAAGDVGAFAADTSSAKPMPSDWSANADESADAVELDCEAQLI